MNPVLKNTILPIFCQAPLQIVQAPFLGNTPYILFFVNPLP